MSGATVKPGATGGRGGGVGGEGGEGGEGGKAGGEGGEGGEDGEGGEGGEGGEAVVLQKSECTPGGRGDVALSLGWGEVRSRSVSARRGGQLMLRPLGEVAAGVEPIAGTGS